MSNNNVTAEVVSSPQGKRDTLSGILTKFQQAKASGTLQLLEAQKIRIPLMTTGGRVLYLPLIKLTRDPQTNKLYVSNIKNKLPYPIQYLQQRPLDYRPATVEEVQEDQKRILGKSFDLKKVNQMIKTLTFINKDL